MKNIFVSVFLFIALLCSTSILYLLNDQEKENYSTIAVSNSLVLHDYHMIQDPLLDASITRGKLVYTDFCMQCHLPSGEGISKTYPPLRQSDWLTDKRTASIHAIKYGLVGPIEVNGKSYKSTMTAMGLTDQEVADVMNYIMNSWGNMQKEMVTAEEVQAVSK